MTITINSFESPASGTTLSGGSGSNVDGSAAWSSVSIGAGGTLNTDNTRSAHGTQSLKVASGSTAAMTYALWNAVGILSGGLTTLWGRLYMYFTANPSSTLRFMQPLSALGGTSAQFTINTSGKLIVQDVTGTNQSTSTNSVPLNQWFRVEFKIIVGATTGTGEVKLFNSADGTTVTETNTNTNIDTGTDPITQLRVGQCTPNANVGPVWYDSLALSNTVYPGPDTGNTSNILTTAGFFIV